MPFISISYFHWLLILVIAILPLLSPGLEDGAFAVEPEVYKTAIAVGFSGFFLLFWLLSHPLNKPLTIAKTNFYLPILGFLVWNFISFFWLVDIEAGILTVLQYLAMSIGFFLILDAIHENNNNLKRLLKFLVISGFLVAALGLLQYYFRDSVAIQNFSRQAVVPAASFGNKNMSSQFLVMVIPISVIMLWRTYHTKNIILYTLTSVVMLWFLTHTYTRGGWIAIILETLFLLAFVLFDKIKNKQKTAVQKPTQTGYDAQVASTGFKRLIVTIGVVTGYDAQVAPTQKPIQISDDTQVASTGFKRLIITIGMVTSYDAQVASTGFKRLIIAIGVVVYLLGINYTHEGWKLNDKIGTKVASVVAGDGNGRLPAWANTVNLIKDNWLLGVGAGNWEANYPLYYDSSVKDVIYNEQIRLRRLHNSYLEMASNVGLIGFIFLFWLLFLIGQAIIRILLPPDNPNRYLVLALGLGLVGFSISAMVSFPLRVFLPGFLVLVYIGAIAGAYLNSTTKSISMNNDAEESSPNNSITQALTSSQNLPKLLLAPFIVLAVLLAYISYSWLVAGHYHQRGIEYLHAGYYKKSLEHSVQSVSHNRFRSKALGLLGEGLKNINLSLSIEYLERSVKYNPNNSLIVTALANRYYKLGAQKLQQGKILEAKAAFDKHVRTLQHLIKIDKRNVKGHALLVSFYLQSKQIDKAKYHYGQMLEWQKYFIGRQHFGPYDGLVNAIKAMIKPYDKLKQ